MTRSWVYGAALVGAAHLLWFALIFTEAHIDWVMPVVVVMFFVVMNIACLGAFVTASLAPRHGLALAISLAPLTALLATLSNLLLQLTGTHVDLSGFHGNLGLFAVSLAYGIFVSAVGGAIGLWVVRRRRVPDATTATPVTPPADPAPPA